MKTQRRNLKILTNHFKNKEKNNQYTIQLCFFFLFFFEHNFHIFLSQNNLPQPENETTQNTGNDMLFSWFMSLGNSFTLPVKLSLHFVNIFY